MTERSLDVVGIGNAIVDVVAHAEEADIARLGLARGTMTLIDQGRMEALWAGMGAGREVSGGSCANTMAAIASLGGKAGYIGRVRDDQLGAIFAHDMRATGVTFSSPPAKSGPPTARCLIFVTADAQRTMQTYLGACVELEPADVDEKLVAAAGITYLEGYLWDRPSAKAACRKAADACHAAGGELALTLSDPFCVDRWRGEFLTLVENEVDLLFANEAELTSLFETDSFESALGQIRGKVAVAALTRGAKGSVVLRGDETHVIPPAPVLRLVDTTGAGDLYAAGFLRAYTAGLGLAACGRLGSLTAASILGIYGPRPMEPLLPLFEEVRAG